MKCLAEPPIKAKSRSYAKWGETPHQTPSISLDTLSCLMIELPLPSKHIMYGLLACNDRTGGQSPLLAKDVCICDIVK